MDTCECKAGVALLQKNRHGTEVLLVRQANGRWSLPKGKRRPGESIRAAGLRECREETGHQPQSLEFVGWAAKGRKRARFYLWKAEAPFFHRWRYRHQRKHEILKIAWVALTRAQYLLRPWQAQLLARINS
jgi:8-oxo-dGTP pyrophosphatase MutT (NUDIX family)